MTNDDSENAPREIAHAVIAKLESAGHAACITLLAPHEIREAIFGDPVLDGTGDAMEARKEDIEIHCEIEPGAVIEVMPAENIIWDDAEKRFRQAATDEATSLNWSYFFLHDDGYTARIDFDRGGQLVPLFPTPDATTLAKILEQFIS